MGIRKAVRALKSIPGAEVAGNLAKHYWDIGALFSIQLLRSQEWMPDIPTTDGLEGSIEALQPYYEAHAIQVGAALQEFISTSKNARDEGASLPMAALMGSEGALWRFARNQSLTDLSRAEANYGPAESIIAGGITDILRRNTPVTSRLNDVLNAFSSGGSIGKKFGNVWDYLTENILPIAPFLVGTYHRINDFGLRQYFNFVHGQKILGLDLFEKIADKFPKIREYTDAIPDRSHFNTTKEALVGYSLMAGLMFYEMQKGVFTEKLPKDFRESMEELRKKPLGKVATAAIAGVAFPVVVYLSYHLPEYINNVKEVVGEGLQTIANGGPEIPNNLPDASRFKRYIPFIFR